MNQKQQTRRQFVASLGVGIGGAGLIRPQTGNQSTSGEPVGGQLSETALSLPGRGSTYDVLYCLAFGGDFQLIAPGFQPVSRVYRSPKFLWVTNVTEETRTNNPQPLLRGFVQGAEGEFWMGLDNGSYYVTLVFADNEKAHGPFNIYLQDHCEKSEITTKPGAVLKYTFLVSITNEKLKLRLEAESGRTFLLNGLIVQGPPHKAAKRIFLNAPPDLLPSVDDVFLEASPDGRAAFRSCCDWLLKQRLPNGFIGDFERNGRSTSYWWYTAAYPIRAWLAAYDIFHHAEYLDAATRILDELVEEQLPNGAWQQTYRNKPTSALSKAEIEEVFKHRWANTADIGSIATALAVACYYVRGSKRRRYLHAARRYCSGWASRWQLPSGALTNGMENGVPQTKPYSVATGTQAAAFTALYAITHETEFLKRAEKAAQFLLGNWQPDGRLICYPDPSEGLGEKYLQPITQFGDVYYYLDGLCFVSRHTYNRRLQEKTQQVFDWFINGQHGLLSSLGDGPWWPLQDIWDNSKSAGMPQAYSAYRRLHNSAGVERALGLARRFLCTPKFAERLGVMVDDPDLPWGGHSLQSWAGCAVSATGFAALTLAEMISPGVIYLAKAQLGRSAPA